GKWRSTRRVESRGDPGTSIGARRRPHGPRDGRPDRIVLIRRPEQAPAWLNFPMSVIVPFELASQRQAKPILDHRNFVLDERVKNVCSKTRRVKRDRKIRNQIVTLRIPKSSARDHHLPFSNRQLIL